MFETLVQFLLNKKEKGFSVSFKTDDKNYFVYVGNSLHATLNEKEFDKFFEKWKVVNSLLGKQSELV